MALIAIATVLLKIPFMQLAGGLALVWIAGKLVQPAGNGEAHVRSGQSLYHAIGIIVFADVVMSLDNALGVARRPMATCGWSCSGSRCRYPSWCGAAAYSAG